MDNDHYHNILSEEFPSPIRNHDTLPELLDVQEQSQQHDQIQDQHDAESLARDIESLPDIPVSNDIHSHHDHSTLLDHPSLGNEQSLEIEDGNDGLQVGLNHDDLTDRRRVGVKYSQLTPEEKKERQRVQNRKAAEKSRAKRRDEVEGLEVGVAQLSEENARLRARLAELVATRSNVIPPDLSIPPNPPSTKPLDAGVDYNYLSKIQTEIHAAKVLLLEREIQVAKLRLDDPSLGSEDEDLNTARTGLLRQFTKHLYLQAEAGALETMINQVRTEKEEISRQADVIRRDIEHRKAFSDPSLQVQPPDSSDIDGGMGVGVGVGMSGIGHEEVLGDHEEVIGDRSMMDIGGWVDAAWQASGHQDVEMDK